MPALLVKEKPQRQGNKYQDDGGHDSCQHKIGARRGANPAQVDQRHGACECSGQKHVRNPWHQTLHGQCAVHGADEGDNQVIEKHRPPGQETQVRVQAVTDESVGGTGGRVNGGHAAITECGQQHGEHGQHNRGDRVAIGEFLRHTEQGHGRNGHDEHDAVQDQIPQRQYAFEARREPRRE